MVKVFWYLRVSTDDKGQDALNQEAELKELHRELCVDVEYKVWVEEASAWRDNERPVFNRMLQEARKAKVSHILAFDFDRVYRNRRRVVSLVKEYQKLGIVIISVRQKWLLDVLKAPEPWNEILYDLLLQVIGWMNEEESNKRSDRVKASFERKKRLGKADNWGRPRIPVEAVKLIQELKAEGLSVRKIQAELMKKDIKVSTGAISGIK